MVRIQPHRLTNPLGPLLVSPPEAEDLSHRTYRAVIVGIEKETALHVRLSTCQVVTKEPDMSQDPIAFRIVFVELARTLGGLLRPRNPIDQL